MAAVERQKHLLLHHPAAGHGDGRGVRHLGDGLEISAGRLLAAGHGGDVLRHRADWRDHSRGRAAQAATRHLDRLTHRLGQGRDDGLRPAAHLLADLPAREGHGGL